MLVGHVPMNRACNVSQECVRGSRCVGGIPGNNGDFAGMVGTGGTAIDHAWGCACPIKKRASTATSPPTAIGALHLPTTGSTFAARPQLASRASSSSTCDGHRCQQLRRVPPPLLRPKRPTPNGVCRRYPTDSEPCNQTSLPQCDPDPALALTVQPVRGHLQAPPATKGTRAALPPSRPAATISPCHPTQRDGIGDCGSDPRARGSVHRSVRQPGGLRRGNFCTAPGTLPARGALHLQHRLRLALVHRLPVGPAVLFAADVFLCPLRGRRRHAGEISGNAGTGGGSFPTGFAGQFAGGRGPPGPRPPAAGGRRRQPVRVPFCDIAPGDPIIADFDVAMGSTPILPIGGTFTYGITVSDGRRTIATVPGTSRRSAGRGCDSYWGVGIYFIGSPTGIACIDATSHTGVQFDISGTIDGAGCTAQYATNDSAHTSNAMFDLEGIGDRPAPGAAGAARGHADGDDGDDAVLRRRRADGRQPRDRRRQGEADRRPVAVHGRGRHREQLHRRHHDRQRRFF